MRSVTKKAWYERNRDRILKQRKQHYLENRESEQAQNIKYRKNNPDKVAASKRRYHLKRMFGISVALYDSLFQKQDGSCAICGRAPEFQSLAVDHCHKTGHIRGLLCVRCNRGLGLFGDNAERLDRASTYLKESYE